MKYFFIYSFFLSTFVYGQTDTLILKIAVSRPNRQIVYTDKVERSIIDYAIQQVGEKRHFKGILKTDNLHSLNLTKEEQKYLIDQLKKNELNIWQDSLFHDSRCIPIDSIWTFLEKQKEEYKNQQNSVKKSEDILQLDQNKPCVFTFTKPIYFRDNSFCLLYRRKLFGKVRGNQELCFYKMDGGVWTKWIWVSGGDW